MTLASEQRARLADEVIELGEQLFALVLEGQQASYPSIISNPDQATDTSEPEPISSFPLAEIEAARDEFFTALRLLLRTEQQMPYEGNIDYIV